MLARHRWLRRVQILRAFAQTSVLLPLKVTITFCSLLTSYNSNPLCIITLPVRNLRNVFLTNPTAEPEYLCPSCKTGLQDSSAWGNRASLVAGNLKSGFSLDKTNAYTTLEDAQSWRLNQTSLEIPSLIGLCYIHQFLLLPLIHAKMPLSLGQKVQLHRLFYIFMAPNISVIFFSPLFFGTHTSIFGSFCSLLECPDNPKFFGFDSV